MWVRLDDAFPEGRKVIGLSADAFRLYVEALCYCGKNLTDGLVPTAALRRLWAPETAAELVEAGLWDTAEGGYEVNDYLAYNPSRAKVEDDREKAAERKRRWVERQTAARAAKNSAGNGVPNSAGNPHPDPTRPDLSPKEREVGVPDDPQPEAWDPRDNLPHVGAVRDHLKAVTS